MLLLNGNLELITNCLENTEYQKRPKTQTKQTAQHAQKTTDSPQCKARPFAKLDKTTSKIKSQTQKQEFRFSRKNR
jgi:hypothetical protein